ncbi:MAG: hypothetical protein OQJ78_05780 [Ignavibacteriaceae bacterium]|nr:hypothetical protein [Ignavibacteriaceae bacterium]
MKWYEDKVGIIMQCIEAYRKGFCQRKKVGLTTLYNQMLLEKKHLELRSLHKQLDEAVAELYDFPKEDLEDEQKILSFLLNLNRQRTQ